jgi:5-methylcytosine-specific restriction enzyme A
MNNRFLGKLIDSKKLPKNENGVILCRWCSKPVKPPRRTMCSSLCAHEIRIRTNNKYLRECLFKRDNGICKICNQDTKSIAKTALKLDLEQRNIFLKNNNISLKRKIWKRKFGGGLWDADHILPVKDGGGSCGLENLRTLCISCHKLVTANSKKKI